MSMSCLDWLAKSKGPVPPIYTSRRVSLGVLLHPEECDEMFKQFSRGHLLNTASVINKGEEGISKEEYCAVYGKYLEKTLRGEEYLHPLLNLSLTVDETAVIGMQVGEDRLLLREVKPMIKIRPLHFSLMPDGKIESMTFRHDKIFWGIELSYPQIFSSHRDAPSEKIWRNEHYRNSAYFRNILKWICKKSQRVTFTHEGKPVHAPFRLGFGATTLIERHQQLKQANLQL